MSNVVWVRQNGRNLLDLDEAGYTAMAVSVGSERDVGGYWEALQEGTHGPLQAILATPVQWVAGPSSSILIWQSIVLFAAAAVAAAVLARRLSGHSAGLVTLLLVLLAPGTLDYSRSALTVAPAVAFTTFGIVAAARSQVSHRSRWMAAAGAAAAAASLGRSMAVVSVVPIAVAAVGWTWSSKPARADRLRAAASMAGGWMAVGGWWWLARGADVFDYLSTGSADAEAEALGNPLVVVLVHTFEVTYYLGLVVPVVMLSMFLWSRRRARRGGLSAIGEDAGSALADEDRAPDDPMRRLPVWPLWISVLSMVLVASVSAVVPRGGMMPLVPTVLIAIVVGVTRRLDAGGARVWAATTISVAVLVASFVTLRGPAGNQVWCTSPLIADVRSTCGVRTGAAAAKWRSAIDDVVDRVHQVSDDRDGSRVAVQSRDWIVNQNSLGLASEIRYGRRTFTRSLTDEIGGDGSGLAAALDGANIVVVVPDRDGAGEGAIALGRDSIASDMVIAALPEAGFVECGAVELPDGRIVQVAVATRSGGCGSS